MNRRMELTQAIDAGNRALESLLLAQKQLKSAGRWGLFDLFGGGAIAGWIKHGKAESAAGYIHIARGDLRIFERELQDVHLELDFEIGDFLTFADFFFDGAVADYLVQRRISKAKKDVDKAVEQVRDILTQLMNQYSRMD